MKKIVAIGICFLLVGCNNPSLANDSTMINRPSIEKKQATKDFFEGGSLKPITIKDHQDFYSINEWYDQHTVIYAVGEEGMSSLYLQHLPSGHTDLFFQTTEYFAKIEANSNHSLFAIQTVDKQGVSHLRIMNKEGREIYTWSAVVEELQFSWNPYKNDELILTTFFPYLEYSLFKVDAITGVSTEITVQNPFIQWITENQIGYLNWNQKEPSIHAQLYVVDLNTLIEKKWLDEYILFFSMDAILVTMTADSGQMKEMVYTFHDSQTGKIIKEIKIPILNTYSEAWWIPSHDFDKSHQLFYYMRPKRSGDILEYNEGFELTMLSMKNDHTEVLLTVPHNFPIKLSPDGKWFLMGNQFEQLLDVSSKQAYELVSEER